MASTTPHSMPSRMPATASISTLMSEAKNLNRTVQDVHKSNSNSDSNSNWKSKSESMKSMWSACTIDRIRRLIGYVD